MPPPQLSRFLKNCKPEERDCFNALECVHRSKPDGADFYVGKDKLGHIHLHGAVHLAAGKESAAGLIKNKPGKKFPMIMIA